MEVLRGFAELGNELGGVVGLEVTDAEDCAHGGGDADGGGAADGEAFDGVPRFFGGLAFDDAEFVGEEGLVYEADAAIETACPLYGWGLHVGFSGLRFSTKKSRRYIDFL